MPTNVHSKYLWKRIRPYMWIECVNTSMHFYLEKFFKANNDVQYGCRFVLEVAFYPFTLYFWCTMLMLIGHHSHEYVWLFQSKPTTRGCEICTHKAYINTLKRVQRIIKPFYDNFKRCSISTWRKEKNALRVNKETINMSAFVLTLKSHIQWGYIGQFYRIWSLG